MNLLVLTTPQTAKILTIHETPVEDDAFEYNYNYDVENETIFTKICEHQWDGFCMKS